MLSLFELCMYHIAMEPAIGKRAMKREVYEGECEDRLMQDSCYSPRIEEMIN